MDASTLSRCCAFPGGEPFDEKAFVALPEHLRRRIPTRLDNLAKPMAAASKRDPAPNYSDPALQVLSDHETSGHTAKTAAVWRHLALVVCYLRTVRPSVTSLAPR
jgi:hypothetical protein